MGLAQSLYTGLSGMSIHNQKLSTLGNNTANVNTVGYKQVRHAFKDLLSHTFQSATPAEGGHGSVNGIGVGLGGATGATTRIFSGGNIENTDNPLDFAIAGKGFFVLREMGGATDFYTRDGTFYLYSDTLDFDPATGDPQAKQLLAGDGFAVQGYMSEDGTLPAGGQLEDIFIPYGEIMVGTATTTMALSGNLFAGDGPVPINTVPTGAGTDWVSDNGRALSVGHIETTSEIWDTGGAATAATDLANLEYGSAGDSMFDLLQAGDIITTEYDRGGYSESVNFVYGTAGTTYTIGAGANAVDRIGNGTTLAEFMTFLTGGLGDDGVAGTERFTGGAMGTIRTREYTDAADGFDAPAEDAGAYLRNNAGQTSLSIASNLGQSNAITNITFVHEGKRIDDLFDSDFNYDSALTGGSSLDRVDFYEEVDGTLEELSLDLDFALVSRDTNSSVWRYTAGEEDTDGATAGAPNYLRSSGLIEFDQEGNVLQFTQDAGGTLALDLNALTQVSLDESNIELIEQDGNVDGRLTEFTVDPDGVINGYYDNGRYEIIGRIGMALIPNEQGLQGIGDNLFVQTAATGDAVYNSDPTDERFGDVRQSALESSNVDLTTELTEIVTTQRAYQANSRVVTTTDEMLQTLVALGR